MLLFPKQFFRKRQITQLLSRFKLENGGDHVYVLPPTKTSDQSSSIGDPVSKFGMYHKSDGIVFQPNSPYGMKTDTSLLKWKWPELCSVDLQLTLSENRCHDVTLMAGGPDNVLVQCTQKNLSTISLLNISNFDTYRMRADVEEFVIRSELESGDGVSSSSDNFRNSKGNRRVVVEMTYLPNVGNWMYHCIRGDKLIPNSINTVMSVLMELADGVTVEELEYTLLARTSDEKDYLTQCNKMKDKALSFQRERTAR